MVGALSFSPILKSGPYPAGAGAPINARLEPGPRLLASGQDVAHVARVPAATACSSHASVVECISDLLQRGRTRLAHLFDDWQHVAGETLGLGFASLARDQQPGLGSRIAASEPGLPARASVIRLRAITLSSR
jgi:hypothetical protein